MWYVEVTLDLVFCPVLKSIDIIFIKKQDTLFLGVIKRLCVASSQPNRSSTPLSLLGMTRQGNTPGQPVLIEYICQSFKRAKIIVSNTQGYLLVSEYLRLNGLVHSLV